MTVPEATYEAGVQEALERTGVVSLLDALGEELPMERQHTERTGRMAMHVMAQMGESEQAVIRTGFAVTPHDVGKIDKIVQELVRKPAKLTNEEMIEVRMRHTSLGAGLIRDLDQGGDDSDLMQEALNVALCHHLPPSMLLRMGDKTIRIGQLVDRFDGMTDPTRPYRGARIILPEEALATIRTDFEKAGADDYLAKFTLDCLAERYAG